MVTEYREEIRRLEAGGNVTSVAFSPDGGLALTGGPDSAPRLWDVETGDEVRVFEREDRSPRAIRSVAFSPDGDSIAVGRRTRRAEIHDVQTGELVRTFDGGRSYNTLWPIVFAPDGRHVLLRWERHEVLMTDVDEGDEGDGEEIEAVRRFEGHTGSILDIDFSPDGEKVLTASWDRTARLWNRETGEEIRRFEGHTLPVYSAEFSPDGGRIVTGSWDGTARLWDASSAEEIHRLDGHESHVRAVTFSPDGRTVLTAGDDRTVRLWNAESGTEVGRLRGHDKGVAAIAVAPAP